MKPRQLAQKMIENMRKAAEETWAEHGHELEVEDKKEGKRWVWQYVRDYFGRG